MNAYLCMKSGLLLSMGSNTAYCMLGPSLIVPLPAEEALWEC